MLLGMPEKIQHTTNEPGALHETFSIFIVNSQGEMMLQKRSRRKCHSGGLWSNACSGHSREGERLVATAHRRLREEMGFDCGLVEAFAYRTTFSNGCIENEINHVFIGRHERDPKPSKREADDWKWSALSRIERDLAAVPESYSSWFRLAFPRVLAALVERQKALVLRDYVSVADVMGDLYRVSHDVSERWLHR